MRTKKGFTLIELIVAMVLATMLLGALIPLLVTAQKSTYDAQKKTRAAQAGEAIYTYIAGQLRSAERVFLSDGTAVPTDPPAEKWNQITVGADGLLKVNGVTPYPGSYQEGAALTLTAQGHDRTALDLTVQLGELYEKTSAVSLQNLIRTGFSQTEGVVGKALSAQQTDAGGALTIYYLGGDGSVGVFPTPDPDPDSSHTTPAEDKLTVTVLNKTLRVKAGEEGTIQAYIHVPAGKTASFAWVQSPTGYLTFTETATPATGTLTASGTVTMKVYGTKVTEENKPVQVTLQATLTDATETKQDSCAVTVYEDNKAPDPDLELLWNNSVDAIGSMSTHNPPHRAAGQQLEFNAKDFSQGFSLAPFATPVGAGDIQLLGTWEIEGSEALKNAVRINNTWAGSNYIYISGTPPTGTITIKFTSNGEAQSGGPAAEKYNGKWTETEITFYNWDEVDASLAWSNATSIEYTSYYSESTAAGTLAATAEVSLKATTEGMTDYCARYLTGGMVSLSAEGDTTGLTIPTASITMADLGGRYSVKIPISYAEKLSSEKSVSFLAEIKNNDQQTVLTGIGFGTNSDRIKLTMKSSTWEKPEMKFYFVEADEEDKEQRLYEKDVPFYANNLNSIAATAWLEIKVKEKDFADFLEKNQVEVITYDTTGTRITDPAIGGGATLVTLEKKSGEDKTLLAEVPLYFNKSIEETVSLKFSATVHSAGESNQVTLKVEPIKTSIVLREGQNDPHGRILNKETLYLGKKDPLYITAYDSESPTAKAVEGTWKTTDSRITWWGGSYKEDAISAPAGDRFVDDGWGILHRYKYYPRVDSIYTDKQTTSQNRKKRGYWWNQYSATELTYSEASLSQAIPVTLQLLEDKDHIVTSLSTEKSSEDTTRITVPVGTDLSLYLKTNLPSGTYYVNWEMSPATLFEPIGMREAVNDGKEQKIDLRSKKIPLTEQQEVTVTATWKNTSQTVYGQKTVFIMVVPLQQSLQQYQDGKWRTAAETISCKTNDPVTLRVVGADGHSLKGKWNYPDFLDAQTSGEDLNAIVLATTQSGTYPIIFIPDSSQHPLYLEESITLSVQ